MYCAKISYEISTSDSFCSSLKTFGTSFAHTFLIVRSSVTMVWTAPTERPVSSPIRAMVKRLSEYKTFFTLATRASVRAVVRRLMNCRFPLFRSSASSFSSQYLLLFLKSSRSCVFLLLILSLRHLSVNAIMKEAISSQNMTDPIGFST